MKKTVLLTLALGLMVFFVSAQQKKVAIISVFVDKNLTGDMGEMVIQKISEDPNFNFDEMATEFKNKLFEKYIDELPIELIPEEEVINKEGYEDLETGGENSLNKVRMATPEGYVFIDSRPLVKDDPSIKKAFELIPEADAVMICYLDFSLGSGTGGGAIGGNKIMAYANFKIFDRDAKKVVAIRERAQSKSMMFTALGGTVYDPVKLKELSGEAIEALYEDLEKKLAKNTKKVKKKIEKKLR